MTRADDCAEVHGPHVNHVGVCQRAGYANGRADVIEEQTNLHRDLVSRLGFGDNITEPMADNDTIVAWFEQQGRDASEWIEHELWRGDCYAAGHPDDEDCDEHGPTCCNRTHPNGEAP